MWAAKVSVRWGWLGPDSTASTGATGCLRQAAWILGTAMQSSYAGEAAAWTLGLMLKLLCVYCRAAMGAMDQQLVEFICSLAASNVGFANIANRLQELAHTQFYRRQLTYLSYAKEAEAAAVAARGEGACPAAWPQCTVQLPVWLFGQCLLQLGCKRLH